MKKILFVIVSAIFATTSFATNAMESISNRFNGTLNDSKIEKQKNQPLILQKNLGNNTNPLAWHYSHSSHYSHGSHSSHSSHSSHYSGRW